MAARDTVSAGRESSDRHSANENAGNGDGEAPTTGRRGHGAVTPAGPEHISGPIARELARLAGPAFDRAESARVDRRDADADADGEASVDELDQVVCAWCRALVARVDTFAFRLRDGSWARQCSNMRECRRRVSAKRKRPTRAEVAADLDALRRRVARRRP